MKSMRKPELYGMMLEDLEFHKEKIFSLMGVSEDSGEMMNALIDLLGAIDSKKKYTEPAEMVYA